MSKEHPTRRDLMKPVQLLGLALVASLFSGLVTLISMGFFQQRFASQSPHALVVALVVTGIVFIVTIVVIALLLLAVDPAEVTRELDRPVLLPKGAAAPATEPAIPAERAEAEEPAAGEPAAGEPDADSGPAAPRA
ncbi:MAG: amino acid transporter [Microbacterium sp.]|uniref:amino acid transporter n=1 Tax=Microbacterium sp. TaxID=51671 RepID=UPI001AC522C0|nr:amino acid transporter [Microbacterium sp.]MBN9154005.1 amino acid transporter [Microbacterium sp.]MBN9185186.1 amino acid transporter [Microbacterium sp.]MBN9187763.1 amino acid transporter [Microbacterium sp.]